MNKPIPVQQRLPFHFKMGERRIVLISGDLIMGSLALMFSIFWWDRSTRFLDINFSYLQSKGYLWFYLLPVIWIFLMVDLYDLRRALSWKRTIRGIITSALITLGVYAVIYVIYASSPETLMPRLSVAIFIVSASILTLVWRMVFIWIFSSVRFLRRVLIVGAGRAGTAFLDEVTTIHPIPYRLIGIIDDDPEKLGKSFNDVKVIGNSANLLAICVENEISDIIVAITGPMQSDLFQAILEAQENGFSISRMPVMFEELTGRVPIQTLEADWILRTFIDQARIGGFFELFKRIIDIFGGLLGTLMFVISFPFIGFLILLDDGWPLIYTQVRSGKGGKPYKILKYRTMRVDAEADGRPRWAKEDDVRATRIGRILRKTHIDELPQFINVLNGDMSLVGPRAERPELVELFQKSVPFYRARLLVKPGITGWAQINYGYASTVEETMIKLEYDLYYIMHKNLVMDTLILIRTPSMMLGFRGR